MDTVLLIAGVVGVAWLLHKANKQRDADANAGASKLVCPHCHQTGMVTVRVIDRSKGVSGGKAAGAVMTGGLSVAATGLSKNVPTRHLTCGNCKMEWDVS